MYANVKTQTSTNGYTHPQAGVIPRHIHFLNYSLAQCRDQLREYNARTHTHTKSPSSRPLLFVSRNSFEPSSEVVQKRYATDSNAWKQPRVSQTAHQPKKLSVSPATCVLGAQLGVTNKTMAAWKQWPIGHGVSHDACCNITHAHKVSRVATRLTEIFVARRSGMIPKICRSREIYIPWHNIIILIDKIVDG
jgi:hypothetical protein